ncbi:peptidylprolyl isomerase [soil metagenome]
MIRTRQSAWVLTAALSALAALSLAGSSHAQSGAIHEGVAAVVNDQIISNYDLKQRILLMVGRSGIRPTAENTQELQQQALYDLIDDRLKLQELKRMEKERKAEGKIIIPESEVDEEIADIAKRNNISPAQYIQVLGSWGVDQRTERERIRADKSWSYWIGGYYGRRVKISQTEIDATLNEIASRATKPSYQIGEIFIDAGRAGGADKALQLANQLVAQLQQNTPFQTVAVQFSGVPTAANGGDAGWLSAGEMRPEVEAAVEQLRPGQLSKPIPVRDGVYIVYLRDKRAGGGSPVVNLKQVALRVAPDATPQQVESARVKLANLKGKINGCATLEKAAESLDGAAAGDLGEAEVKDLAPAFRDAAEKLAINQVSDPIRTDIGLHLVAVCGRRDSAVDLPTRAQIQSGLENEKLSLIAKREMLNLRTAATIETR